MPSPLATGNSSRIFFDFFSDFFCLILRNALRLDRVFKGSDSFFSLFNRFFDASSFGFYLTWLRCIRFYWVFARVNWVSMGFILG